MIATAVAAALLAVCPKADPWFVEREPEVQAEIRADCAAIDEDPVYLGRLRSRRVPIEFGIGNAVSVRDEMVFGGVNLRLAATFGELFVAVDGSAVFSLPGYHLGGPPNLQTGALSLGTPIALGEWLFRPTVAVGASRFEVIQYGVFFGIRTSATAALGAEILIPSRALALGIDAGFSRPIFLRSTGFARAEEIERKLRPGAHVGGVLTWYFL